MISVPVYSDENGIPQVSIYVEDEDGTFRRTQSEPLRLLRDDIQGISIAQGDLVSGPYDRQERDWKSPTVSFHYGRPQSFYRFLREKVARNRFFVFSKPQFAGHISKLTLHELQLKNSTSQRKISILKEKYVEALQLWPEDQLEQYAAEQQADAHSVNDSSQSQVTNAQESNQRVDNGRGNKQNVVYFRKQSPSESSSTVVSRDIVDPSRKNLIQEFSLNKPAKRAAAAPKAHNRHFYKRFIFTID